jgi:hypothetical protein
VDDGQQSAELRPSALPRPNTQWRCWQCGEATHRAPARGGPGRRRGCGLRLRLGASTEPGADDTNRIAGTDAHVHAVAAGYADAHHHRRARQPCTDDADLAANHVRCSAGGAHRQDPHRDPNAVRAMAEAGHVIGSHSDTHPDFTTLTTADRAAQLTDAQAAIGPLIDGTTKPWFRFPFGAADPAAIAEVNGNGYACIGWTVDTLGWKGTSGGQSVDTVVSRVLAALQPGEIVLMHVGANPEDGSTLDAAALPTIIGDLRERDYGFVTLAAALP